MSAVQLDCHTCATCLILESQNLQDFKSRISGYQQCHPSKLVAPEDAKQNYPANDGQIQFLYSCTSCDPYIKIRYLTIMLWLRRIDNLRFLYFGTPVHGGGRGTSIGKVGEIDENAADNLCNGLHQYSLSIWNANKQTVGGEFDTA